MKLVTARGPPLGRLPSGLGRLRRPASPGDAASREKTPPASGEFNTPPWGAVPSSQHACNWSSHQGSRSFALLRSRQPHQDYLPLGWEHPVDAVICAHEKRAGTNAGPSTGYVGAQPRAVTLRPRGV